LNWEQSVQAGRLLKALAAGAPIAEAERLQLSVNVARVQPNVIDKRRPRAHLPGDGDDPA
jgi:hypothetical protein